MVTNNNMSLDSLKAKLCARAAKQSETTEYENGLIGLLSKQPYCNCQTVKELADFMECERLHIKNVEMKKVEKLETVEMVDENRRLYKEAHKLFMYVAICEEILKE